MTEFELRLKKPRWFAEACRKGHNVTYLKKLKTDRKERAAFEARQALTQLESTS